MTIKNILLVPLKKRKRARANHLRFIAYFFASVFLTTLGLLTLNYLIDPAGYFSEREFIPSKIAQMLARGDNVRVPTFRDERAIQKMRLKYDNSRPEILVVGSSRSMQIDSDILHAKVMNLSVSGCTLFDYLPLTISGEQKFSPRKIFLGLDPWIFNENFGSLARCYNDDYLSAITKLDIKPRFKKIPSPVSFREIMSLEYTGVSIHYLFDILFHKRTFFPTKDNHATEDLELIHQDGSISYQPEMDRRSLEKSEAMARDYARPPIFGFDHYGYSTFADESLIKMLYYLQKKSEVEIMLLPYNPIAFETIRQSSPEVVEIENRIRQIGIKLGIKIWGSYDPVKCHCDVQDFYDGMHLRSSACYKVFSPNS